MVFGLCSEIDKERHSLPWPRRRATSRTSADEVHRLQSIWATDIEGKIIMEKEMQMRRNRERGGGSDAANDL